VEPNPRGRRPVLTAACDGGGPGLARSRPWLLALSTCCWPFNPSPPVSQAARRLTETIPAVNLRKPRLLIITSSVTVRFSSPLRCALKLPSSRKAVSSIRTPEVRMGRSDLSRPQHMLSFALKLPDPLLRHPQLLRELCEGRGLFLVEAVPLDQHAPMALR
jgi:hypothetical protein